jgi:hypothetical protein
MKCKYRFEVVSDGALDQAYLFRHENLQFKVVPVEGRIAFLEIECDDSRLSRPAAISKDSDGATRLRIPHDPVLSRVQAELRSIRGALAFWGIHDILIDNPEVTWIPSTQQEKEQTDVLGFAMKLRPIGQNTPHPVVLNLLLRTLMARAALAPLHIPLEFCRRGIEDHYYGRYIEAIYDFYFVLEYLFGDGKFNTSGVLKAFTGSKQLCDALLVVRKTLPPEDRDALGCMEELYLKGDVDAVFSKLISVRGELHHQSIKRKETWDPSLQGNFKHHATFFRALAHEVATKLAVDVLMEDEHIKTSLSIAVFAADGRQVHWVPDERDV